MWQAGFGSFNPFGNRLRGGVEPTCGSSLGQAAIHHFTNHLLSTFRGQAGILVGVHSVPPRITEVGNISVPSPDRMDNLLKVHS